MWSLTLELRIKRLEGGVKMNEYDRIFKDISDDVINRDKMDHNATLSCVRVLNDTVQPAIRDLAASKLKPSQVKSSAMKKICRL